MSSMRATNSASTFGMHHIFFRHGLSRFSASRRRTGPRSFPEARPPMRSRSQAAEGRLDVGSHAAVASFGKLGENAGRAGVAELADAPDLGSGIARCGGSSPSARTIEAEKTRSDTATTAGRITVPTGKGARDERAPRNTTWRRVAVGATASRPVPPKFSGRMQEALVRAKDYGWLVRERATGCR